MKTKYSLQPRQPVRVAVSSRFLNIHKATAEFRVNFEDGVPVYVDSDDYMDFLEGSESGKMVTFVNETDTVIDVELSFSPFKLYRRKRVKIDQLVPVSVQDIPDVGIEEGSSVGVNNFPAVQAVSLPDGLVLDVIIGGDDPVKVEEDYTDRVMVFGNVVIPADGSTVEVDFSGAYGFGFEHFQGASWNGIDLSDGFEIAESSNRKMNASGDVSAVAGDVISWWRID